jgi:hypothetical protein
VSEPKIITEHWPKPIPIRGFDWTAITEDYDDTHPIGHGKTEADAIADLLEQLEDKP